MANSIKLDITGDSTLQQNVDHAKQIEKSINNAYEDWRKMGANSATDENLSKTTAEMKKLSKEAEDSAKSIKELKAQQSKLDKVSAEYNSTLKKSNQIQTSYASDLQKTNAKIEVLKANQKLLTAEGKKSSAQFVKNKVTLKELGAQYRVLEKEKLQDIQVTKTLAKLDKKQNITLKEQKLLFGALSVQYNKLVTKEGKAAKSTIALSNRLGKLSKSIRKADIQAGSFKTNIGNYPGIMGKVSKASGGAMMAIMAVGMALSQAWSKAKQFVEMSNAQVLAEKKLEVVMVKRMGASKTDLQSIIELTSAQQALGVVGDEIQLAGAAQVSTFLNQKESLKLLLPQMNNLAVANYGLGVTQEQTTKLGNLFGKVMQGQTSALAIAGITMTDYERKMFMAGDELERAAILAQVVNNNVGDMNEAFAQTDEGKMQQAKNELGDIGEILGKKLLPVLANVMQGFLKIAQGLKQFAENIKTTFQGSELQKGLQDAGVELSSTAVLIKEMSDELKGSEEQMANFKEGTEKVKKAGIKYFFKGINDKIKVFNVLFQISKEVMLAIWRPIRNMGLALKEAGEWVWSLGSKMEQAGEKSKFLVKISDEVDAMGVTINAVFSDFTKWLKTVSDAVLKYIQPTIDYFEKLGQSIGFLRTEEEKLANTPPPVVEDDADARQKVEDERTRRYNEKKQKQIDDNLARIQKAKDAEDAIASGGTSGGGTTTKIDIFAQKQAELTIETSKKELELRRKYKDDSEQIELELLQFKQAKQLELLQFVDDNNLADKKIEQDLKYLDISKTLEEKELEIENNKYTDLYDDYQDYIEKKDLANEAYILGLEQSGADETKISYEKLSEQKQMLTDYLSFLQNNANESNEIERLQLQNQLLDVENQLSSFGDNLEGKDEVVQEALGLTDEDFAEIKDSLADLGFSFLDFQASKLEMEQEALDNKLSLIDTEISAEQSKQDELNSILETENDKRDQNLENDALYTESQIRLSELEVEAKKSQQAELIKQQEAAAKKLKQIQKAQILAQLALDSSSAVSSIVKYAFASPVNAVFPGYAAGKILTDSAILAANILKARSAIKQLAKGEVLINGDGTETSDDIPTMLSRNESVITAKGSKRTPNFLKALNKDVAKNDLLNALQVDLGANILKDYNINVGFDSYELKKQNENLQRQISETQKNNVYLSKLLNVTENKADYIPTPNGYRKITKNGEKTITFGIK